MSASEKRKQASGDPPAGDQTTRDQIFLAALELFAEEGYERTTFKQISKRSGASQGSISWSFPTKEDLFVACLEYFFSKWMEKIISIGATQRAQKALDGAAQDGKLSAGELMKLAFDAHKDLMDNDRILIRLYMMFLAEAMKPGGGLLLAKYRELRDALIVVAEQMEREYPELSEATSGRMLGRMFFILAGGVSFLAVVETEDEYDSDEVYGAVFEVVRRGLGVEHPEGAPSPAYRAAERSVNDGNG